MRRNLKKTWGLLTKMAFLAKRQNFAKIEETCEKLENVFNLISDFYQNLRGFINFRKILEVYGSFSKKSKKGFDKTPLAEKVVQKCNKSENFGD